MDYSTERAAILQAADSLTKAQAAYDNRAEPEVPDGYIDEASARDIAKDMLASTPKVVADWLQGECCAAWDDLHWGKLQDRMREGDTLSTPELLVVAICGHNAFVITAMYELRDRFEAAHKADVDETAREILRRQELEGAAV